MNTAKIIRHRHKIHHYLNDDIKSVEEDTHFKIVFHAEIFNQQDELLNTGEVSLFFVDAKTMKRCDMPEVLREKLSGYFINE